MLYGNITTLQNRGNPYDNLIPGSNPNKMHLEMLSHLLRKVLYKNSFFWSDRKIFIHDKSLNPFLLISQFRTLIE